IPYEVYKNDHNKVVGTSGPSYYIYSSGSGTLTPYGGGSGGWSWLDGCKITVYPITEKFALVIYGEAHWLKEMFQVNLVVHNDSALDSLSDTVATLELPEGMSLADMVSGQQTASQILGDIPSKGSANAIWYVRGDAEGEYTLKAFVEAVSEPNGDTITAEFETTDPVKVYAGSALHMTITCEDMAERGKDYPVKFRLENVSDRTLYNLSFGLTAAEQYKIVGYGDKESWLPITDCQFGEAFTKNVDALAPGGYIEMELSTTIWFNSALELIAFTKLGAFVDVAYYLTDVSVLTMEGSTTEIPYDIVVERAERDTWIDWLIDIVSDELLGDELPSGDVGGTMIEIIGEGLELDVPFIKYAKTLLKLQQGETNYTLVVSIDDGRGTANSVENDIIRITDGTEGQGVIDFLNGTKWKLSTREAKIELKAPGSTYIKIGVEDSYGNMEREYTLNITGEDTQVKDTLTISGDGIENTFRLDENEVKASAKRVEDQTVEALKKNPFLWIDSGIELKVDQKTSDSNNGYTVIIFNEDKSGGGILTTETHNRISVSGTTASLEFTREGWQSLAEQSGEEFTIAARQLTREEKDALGLDGNIYEFKAESGSSKISSFGDESVIISVPYVLGDADNPDELYVEHFKTDGTSETLNAIYDADSKTVTFETKSFSYFRIGNTKQNTFHFDDVTNPNDYFYEPVYWAVENGITKGTTPTTFSPWGNCMRSQIVTFLWRYYGEPEPTVSNPFTDVKPSDGFYKAVLWAVENGITTGKTPTTFDPWGPCTRGQVVTFLWRAAGKPMPSTTANFKDVKPSDYFYYAVSWAVENGITTGTTPTTFNPWGTCMRAQVVTFLYRMSN
ncbi:MAG: S-layer homology domain-containing protein, partial [Oscillospiraceae bacterium]|nr:S-layer homology domain-containing protein [Oscillospiraceae bacterium]